MLGGATTVRTNPGDAGYLRRKTSISYRFSFFQRWTMKKERKVFSRKAFSALIPTPLMAPVQQHAVLGAAFNMCVYLSRN